MFHLSNNCSTIGGIYSLSQSCMRYMIGELWIQTCIATTFRYNILCVLTRITRKLQVVCRHATYWMTALLSKMFIFFVRAGCEIWMASYVSKHALQSLSDKPLLCIQILRHITWKLQVIRGSSAHRMTATLSETFFACFRVPLEIWLESWSPRQASVVLWFIVCLYCKPVCTSLIGRQLRLTTKLMHLMTAYYSPYDGFTAANTSFCLVTLHIAVSPINCLR